MNRREGNAAEEVGRRHREEKGHQGETGGRCAQLQGRKMYSDDVIRARRFELVDDAGNLRAVFTANPGGAGDELIGMHIANNEGSSVVFVGVDPTLNAPFLTLRDGSGSRGAVFASVTSEGHPAVTLRDGDGEEQIITMDLLRQLRE